ncbi:MAG TPA: DUF4912 domain-containing protein [Spirochaetia bacterium]|nr:DUF4912 domain-containing protein [Spirochaetia bacterium]
MAVEEKAARLPAGYNENVLVLLVQNPNVVFAYLEMSDNFWGALMEQGQPVLRLYDVTGLGSPAGQPVTEVGLPPLPANWYFSSLVAGRTYVSELGWQDGQGLFVSLLRSNPASTPANERVWSQARKKMGSALDRSVAALRPWEDEEDKEKEDTGMPSSYSS